MSKFSGLIDKGKFFVKDFFAHWNTPKEGDYVPNKEFAAYAVGGMGVQGFTALMLYMGLAAGQKLAFIYDFDIMAITYTGLFISVLTILISPVRSWIIDNLRSKNGKFRPYLKWLGPPCLLLFWSLAFIPNWIIQGAANPETGKIAALIVYQIIFFIANTLLGFYTMGMTSLINVITPNGDERTKIQSIGALIYSLGPSITQLFFPIIASLFFGEGSWNVLGTFQWIFPVFGVLFMLLGYLCYFGTKERLVVEKSYQPKVKFWQGIKEVVKNKYFWIINVSNAFGFGRFLLTGTTFYVAVYMMGSSSLEGTFTTIIAMASIPTMLLGPILLKKWDKKNWLLTSYFFTVFISAVMLLISYVGFEWDATPWIFVVLMFMHSLLNTINVVIAPIIGAEYLDYTQLKTGRRLDGFMGQTGGMLVTAIGMATALIVPSLQRSVGITTSTHFADLELLRKAFIIFGWVSIASGILAAIPYFFYDLNGEKHKKIVQELKFNALKKDMEEGNLRKEDYEEARRLGVVPADFGLTEQELQEMETGIKTGEPSLDVLENSLENASEGAYEQSVREEAESTEETVPTEEVESTDEITSDDEARDKDKD